MRHVPTRLCEPPHTAQAHGMVYVWHDIEKPEWPLGMLWRAPIVTNKLSFATSSTEHDVSGQYTGTVCWRVDVAVQSVTWRLAFLLMWSTTKKAGLATRMTSYTPPAAVRPSSVDLSSEKLGWGQEGDVHVDSIVAADPVKGSFHREAQQTRR
ncbi:hypothetical protein LZ32DRAFT_609357 [Colletotrichum eremochloae]|nr:hypothetical protein LZ32DRAFT_609357 [Colletotrichum eremochloae]